MVKKKTLMLASGLFFSSMALAQAQQENPIAFYALAIFALLWLASLIWVSYRALSSENRKEWKALWIIAAIALGIFGALFFFLLGEKKRIPGKKETQKQIFTPKQEQMPQELDLFSKAEIEPTTGFKPSIGTAKQAQTDIGHKKLPAAFSPKSKIESELQDYATKEEFVKPKTRDLFEQFKKEITAQKPEEIVKEPIKEVETPALQIEKPLSTSSKKPIESQITLSDEEKTEVQELVAIIEPEKNDYPKEEILNIVLDKGYSINVARAVLKELFKND